MSPVADAAPKRPLVIVTRRLPGAVEERMSALFDVELNTADTPFDRARMADALARADVLVPTITDILDAELITAAGPQLKMVANFGAGLDHIDRHALAARKIMLTNTPGVLTEDTADLTMALLLSVPRRLVEGERLLREGKWAGWSPTFHLGTRVRGKTLGIIGMGRIGRAVAQRAAAFGMVIQYHNRNRLPVEVEARTNAQYFSDLDRMLSGLDFLSLNCPLTSATRNLMDARRLALLPKHAILINTARGEVVDEEALAAGLSAGDLAGAGLDVYSDEPMIAPSLLQVEQAVLSPHLASATIESRTEMGVKVFTNIRTYMDGHNPPDRVLPPKKK